MELAFSQKMTEGGIIKQLDKFKFVGMKSVLNILTIFLTKI